MIDEEPTSIITPSSSVASGRVPLEPYRSQAWFEAEQAKVFGRAWLLMGRVEEVPNAGSFVVKQLEVRSTAAIIARGKDGIVRAFHNVCPHRANQVLWEDRGSASAFVCRYHNWTFTTEGTLRGVPDQGSFPGLDKTQCGLTPIHLEIWDGWLFINLADEPETSLDEFLGDMKKHFSGIHYIHASHSIVIEARLKCNWKIVADAFAEAYHIPAIHDISLKPRFADPSNQFGRPLLTKFMGPHGVNSMFGRPDYAPLETQIIEKLAFDAKYRAAEQSELMANFAVHPAINPTKTASWSMDVNYLFPNTHIDTNRLGFFTHQFWPISVDETRHVARYYVGRPLNVRERFAIEHRMAHAVDIVLEDLSNVERTQQGVNSRGTQFMQLSESEALIKHAADHIARWVSAPNARDALVAS